MTQNSIRELNRLDALFAALSGGSAFVVYALTLAPDLLYGDSAELQTLVYTLGHTHSTGYPVYLMLARLVGFLPVQTLAWRVNLFSALMAALAVAGTYLLSRMLTNSRAGAWLASAWLALSYTLWSQAILAEVYAPGAAFMTWILLLTLHWRQSPEKNGRSLFSAAALAGLSLGVHATAALAVLPSAGFIFLDLVARRANRLQWMRALLAGISGAALGIALWLGAFLYIDRHNPPSSFINTSLYPSRSIWGLTPQDFDSPFKRIYLTVSAVQWRDMLFAGGGDAARQSGVDYLRAVTTREFSAWFLILAIYGGWASFARAASTRWSAGYLVATYSLVMLYVLNYRPGDQYVFFLSTYIPLTALVAAGNGVILESLAQSQFLIRHGWATEVRFLAAVVLAASILASPAAGRLSALETGVAGFVREDYQFPAQHLKEPQILAGMILTRLPDDAVVLAEWRELYALIYLAQVEGKKPGIIFYEAMPRGHSGKVADSMIETIRQALEYGHPVYAAQRFPGLEEHFQLEDAANRYVEVKRNGGNER